jgi:hypothetical protein
MSKPGQERVEDDLTFIGACHGCIALPSSQVDDFYRAQSYVSFMAVVSVLVTVLWLI